MKLIKQYIFILLLLLTTLLLGYNYVYRPFQTPAVITQPNEINDSDKMDSGTKSAEEIFEKLNSRERILQMIAAPVIVNPDFEETGDNSQASNSANLAVHTKYGFYTLFGNAISKEQAKNVVSNLKQDNLIGEVAPLIAVDHEGGSVQRLSGVGYTKLDSWQKVCALEPIERRELLLKSAEDLKETGIDIVLAPVIDVGNNTILKDRICSIDSYAIVADRSMDYVTIFSNLGILPVIKHFPGIGRTTKDLHTSYDYVEVFENDVKLYKYIIDQNPVIGVMASHAGVESQERGIPCSVSPYCVTELLSAYPDVLVFSDALEMAAAAYDKDNPRVAKTLEQVTQEAILAGNNVLVFGESVTYEVLTNIIREMVVKYETNPEFQTKVDLSAKKIIEYKYEQN